MKISIIYPYGFQPPHGANLRMRLLIKYLRWRGHEVRVLAFDSSEEVSEPGLTVCVHEPSLRPEVMGNGNAPARRLASRILWLRQMEDGCAGLGLDATSRMEFELVSRFYAHRLDRNFQLSLGAGIEGADAVFLDEPFFMRDLLPLAQKANVPVILTCLGVFGATYCANAAVKRLLEREELRAARSANALCTVSPEESDYFRRFGLDPTTIINPIDARDWFTPQVAVSRQALLDRFEFLREPFCFFVGGSHFPNVEAARALREMSRQVPGVPFVIAGTCAPPADEGNVHQLGVIPEEALHGLYALAGLVVIPLTEGSGTSLKTVEAMAHGAPILATSVGCRGYAIESGVHAEIRDSLEEYPALIKSLLRDPARREALGKGARSLAQRYDYREVFPAHEGLLRGLVLKSRFGFDR